MNPTKAQILQGEKLLEENKKFAQQLVDATEVADLKTVLSFLFAERIVNLEHKLAKLRPQWAVEFEKESAEVNTKMPAVVANAKKFIGREPKAVSDKIRAIIEKHTAEGAFFEQEEKNDDFYELIEHINFINKKVKNG